MSFLHERGIVHRDIKPDNLVFDSKLPDAAIKLIDFGYAGHCSASQPLRGLCGTPDYAAPEILTWYSVDKTTKPQGTAYAQPVDMWSLGVVLYILLCGFPPFYGDDDEQMFALIRSGSYSFPEAIDGYKTTWGGVSDGAKALVRSLLTVQPAQRASATDVLTGDWLGSVCTPRGGWIGKMRERSTSGWRAAAKPDGKGGTAPEGPRLDRGQIDRGEPTKPTAPVNTDAKMVFGNENYEGKLKYSLEQHGLVSQFSRWIVDRIVKREMRILMLGLDNSGKTSILYRLKLGQPKRTVPTIGFNVETLEYKNIAFTVWDVGGQEKLRALWRHYFASTQALIFVVDSSDRGRLQEAAEELHRLIKEEELQNALLLVLANKQDLPGACNAAEISEEMHLYATHHLTTHRTHLSQTLFPSRALTHRLLSPLSLLLPGTRRTSPNPATFSRAARTAGRDYTRDWIGSRRICQRTTKSREREVRKGGAGECSVRCLGHGCFDQHAREVRRGGEPTPLAEQRVSMSRV